LNNVAYRHYNQISFISDATDNCQRSFMSLRKWREGKINNLLKKLGFIWKKI